MHVIKKKTLLEYCSKHHDAREQLLTWHEDAETSNWNSRLEIKDVYGDRVSFVGDRTVFDIKGNDYRLIVKIEYKFQKVFIRWFGTHPEYDKIKNVAEV